MNGGEEELTLVRRCLDGDGEAVADFQSQFGELIYEYPVRKFREGREKAGDFYVFAFDEGRLFRRLRSFEGRVPLRAYLRGVVLENLLLEWKRAEREVETVAVESLDEFPGDGDGGDSARDEGAVWEEALSRLPEEKAMILRLLHIEDCDLTPADYRRLRRDTGRPLAEVVAGVEHLRHLVRERESTRDGIAGQVDAVQGWIRAYERRLRGIEVEFLSATSAGMAALQAEKRELERKLAWRQRQRQSLRERAQRRKVTAPYREMAALLGTSVSHVASAILRARRELAALAGRPEPASPESGEKEGA